MHLLLLLQVHVVVLLLGRLLVHGAVQSEPWGWWGHYGPLG